MRRKTLTGCAVFTTEGEDVHWEKKELLDTWEKPLRLLSWAMIMLAAPLLAGKL